MLQQIGHGKYAMSIFPGITESSVLGICQRKEYFLRAKRHWIRQPDSGSHFETGLDWERLHGAFNGGCSESKSWLRFKRICQRHFPEWVFVYVPNSGNVRNPGRRQKNPCTRLWLCFQDGTCIYSALNELFAVTKDDAFQEEMTQWLFEAYRIPILKLRWIKSRHKKTEVVKHLAADEGFQQIMKRSKTFLLFSDCAVLVCTIPQFFCLPNEWDSFHIVSQRKKLK